VEAVLNNEADRFEANGYAMARDLFSREEVDFYIDPFVQLREADSNAEDLSVVDSDDDDPVKVFPRMIQMHRWDQVSLDWIIDPRFAFWLEELTGRPVYAVQTMLYFKPAGSRGQVLHQDQFYLKAQLGTCTVAWMALDPCEVWAADASGSNVVVER
jgi:phytanoyl-CoA hydroxylase